LLAAELEARVLCNSPPELIAERCGLTADVVRAFEAVFFDVRHLLEASGYIFHQVIGRPIIDGFSPDDMGCVWKFFAYLRGQHALEILLFVHPGGKPRPWPSTFPATLAERRALVATCRLTVLTRCLKIRDMSAADRARLILRSKWFERLDEADHVTCSETGAISQVDVGSLLGSRVEDPDSRIPGDGIPASASRDLSTGVGVEGCFDLIRWSEPDFANLQIRAEPLELGRRVIA
jgi:hypothetical protein